MRYGRRRLGFALGSVLARASVPVKEWGAKSDGPVSPWLWLEAFAWGCAILMIYGFAIYALGSGVVGLLGSLARDG